MRRVLVIDDEPAVLRHIKGTLEERWDNVEVITRSDPISAMGDIDPDLHLLIIDLEMPAMDGLKMLQFAVQKGIRRSRVIILSSRDTDLLHTLFPHGSCLAVINKSDPNQQSALAQILESVMRRDR